MRPKLLANQDHGFGIERNRYGPPCLRLVRMNPCDSPVELYAGMFMPATESREDGRNAIRNRCENPYCSAAGVRTPIGALRLSVMWLLPSDRMTEPVPTCLQA